jgi:serine/threonine-protein kinase
MQQEIWFHKYRIVKLLGKGGMARVYLAEHIVLNSFRAIKFISKKYPQYNQQRKEAQILKNLKHSCIPTIYDIEEDEEGSYIIEQYIEGDTLKEYVAAKGPPGENIIIRFALSLCDLIQYLHSTRKPLLYPDLKPENIIVSDSALKLIDFGSAVYLDEIKEGQPYSGTRGFAAPELYGNGRIDERCEIYGIGMLMYYMAYGIEWNQNIAEIKNIDEIGSLSKQLKDIINRCLKFNPSQRFSSVTQLNKQLSGILQKKHLSGKSGQSLSIAVAGSQSRIGVTHLALRLCRYFQRQKNSCLYQEQNASGFLWQLKRGNEDAAGNNQVLKIRGIPMLPREMLSKCDTGEYRIRLQDFGCLTKDNLEFFLAADIKILILGAKEWELEYAEQVLEMVTEYKDIFYLFNYLDGRQFRSVLKNMKQQNCYRIPYEPDPFSEALDKNELELFGEITR